MRLIALLTILFSVLAQEAPRVDLGQAKLEVMHKLQAQSKDGVIDFTPEQYKELVLQNPRPYDVTILFTVRFGCDDCDAVYAELTGAEYSYRQKD